MGVTAEKDPGEDFFSGSNRNGFDFYSGHISMKISPLIENITVGDFIVRSGQGLVLWQGFSTGKSASVLNISKTGHGLRPYTSTDENCYFRGIATTLNRGNGQVTLFYSKNNRDANIVTADSGEQHFSSLQSSGYHRTESEIADKNSISDINTGIAANMHAENFKLGFTFNYRMFNLPYIPSTQLYNSFHFTGTKNCTAGMDYLLNRGKFRFFGEGAISKSKGKALLQGVISNLHDQLQFSLLFRHFDKHFHALWASAFSESARAANESGLFLGMRLLPFKYVTLSGYSDFYRSAWINYTTSAPSTGLEFQLQSDIKFSGKTKLYIRYKNKKKNKKSSHDMRYADNTEQYKKTRLHFQYNPFKLLTLKTRVENVIYEYAEKEYGWMIFQDAQISDAKIPVNLSVRLAWFNSDSYNSRIYAYENDLLYTFSIPAYFDEGIRTYLNLKYKISDNLELWFKLAHTQLKDAESISSGYNEILGNKKCEVKFQLRLKI
ncbi:MAG: hypothetical protein PHH93_12025, partial [Prolixibacteraceae bacterium]|nr:hypothetical protein [Prolixibacteraceae bacterium]